MYAVRAEPKLPAVEEDDFVFFHGTTWKDFEAMLAIRGDTPGPRMWFLDGVITLMSPSDVHEYRKESLGRLLEIWSYETGIEVSAYGSWTLKQPRKKAGAEPDKCYVRGTLAGRKVPDLVIEIEWTRRSDDKREIYRRLGVRELWTIRRDGAFCLRVLEDDAYVERSTSAVFPELDMRQLVRFLEHDSQDAAVRAFGAALRKKRKR